MWQKIFKNPRRLFPVKTHRKTRLSCGMLSDVRCAPRISGHTIDVASSKGNSEILKGFCCIAMRYDILLPVNIQFGRIASWDKSVLCAHELWCFCDVCDVCDVCMSRDALFTSPIAFLSCINQTCLPAMNWDKAIHHIEQTFPPASYRHINEPLKKNQKVCDSLEGLQIQYFRDIILLEVFESRIWIRILSLPLEHPIFFDAQTYIPQMLKRALHR